MKPFLTSEWENELRSELKEAKSFNWGQRMTLEEKISIKYVYLYLFEDLKTKSLAENIKKTNQDFLLLKATETFTDLKRLSFIRKD
jgi:hypothetical protein